MLIMVESNEATDRDKKANAKRREEGETETEQSNIRVVKRLKTYFPNLRTAALTCGDINVILDNGAGVLAIERKRAGDFLGSVGSGRIFRQVENMAQNSKWSCVIVEGLISFDADDMVVIPTFDKLDRVTGHKTTQWRGIAIRAAIYAIQWSGCPVLAVEPESLPGIVADLIKFCSKPTEHSQMLGRKRIVTFPPVTLSEEILAAFPGVGLKRARSLLEFSGKQNDNKVGTLAEAISWGSILELVDQKSRPEGWGDKTIENFRASLGLEVGDYSTIQEDKKRKSQYKAQERNKK